LNSSTPAETNRFDVVFGSKVRIKILKVLALDEELNLSQVIKKTKLNYSCVCKHLTILVTAKLIQEKKFGRIKIYRFKVENLKAKSFNTYILI